MANVRVKATAEKDWTDVEIVEADSGRRLVEETTGGPSAKRRTRGTYMLEALPGRGNEDQLRARDPRDPQGERLMGPLNRAYVKRVNRKAMKRLEERSRASDLATSRRPARSPLPSSQPDWDDRGASPLRNGYNLGDHSMAQPGLGTAAARCSARDAARIRVAESTRPPHPGVDPVADLADPDHLHAAPQPRRPEEEGGADHHHPSRPGRLHVPDAYQDFRYTGIDCTAAVAVAKAWDQNGKTCNTVDNPESPIGPQRTCSVKGFRCTAKRDIHSDARFVTCTQGGQSVRFTWLPA